MMREVACVSMWTQKDMINQRVAETIQTQKQQQRKENSMCVCHVWKLNITPHVIIPQQNEATVLTFCCSKFITILYSWGQIKISR